MNAPPLPPAARTGHSVSPARVAPMASIEFPNTGAAGGASAAPWKVASVPSGLYWRHPCRCSAARNRGRCRPPPSRAVVSWDQLRTIVLSADDLERCRYDGTLELPLTKEDVWRTCQPVLSLISYDRVHIHVTCHLSIEKESEELTWADCDRSHTDSSLCREGMLT